MPALAKQVGKVEIKMNFPGLRQFTLRRLTL